jgi:hypothetical protein
MPRRCNRFATAARPAPGRSPPRPLPDGDDDPLSRRQPWRNRRANASPAPRSAARQARRVQRPQRGTNARLVEEVLQSNAPRALRPAEIRTAIQRDKGVAIAFTSIRHALGQLEQRRIAEQIADSKTWRFHGAGTRSD